MTQQIQNLMAEIESDVFRTRGFTGKDKLDPNVITAMLAVPREQFVPADLQGFAYANDPLPIGHGQTISQPYIVALMTDLLDLKPDAKVLEIGTGSGYQAAVLSLLAQKVYSVETIAALAEAAKKQLKDLHYTNIEIQIGNGYQGWAEHAPYDAIIVTAASADIPPALIEQLKVGGKMVIPIGLPYEHQQLLLVEKDQEDHIEIQNILSVTFVPLVHGSNTLF